jgi:3-oxoacyl-[acyl-carrier-protein] synthase-3
MSERTRGPAILGVGAYLPGEPVTNNQLISRTGIDSTDAWIRQRTGIEQRHISEHEKTSDMCAKAVIQSLNMAGVRPEDVDQLIVATVTPDMPFPSTASLVRNNIGASNGGILDIGAACAGSVYGLATLYGLISSATSRNGVVVGGERLSSITDWNDRSTAILFGDGAGSMYVDQIDNPGPTAFVLSGNTTNNMDLYCPPQGTIHMNGAVIFDQAVRTMADLTAQALEKAGLANAHGEIDPHKVDLLIPHQANLRIIQAVARRLHVPMEKVYTNVQKRGNTSAASIPIAMFDALQEGRVHPGDIVAMASFGAGLASGAGVIEWHIQKDK